MINMYADIHDPLYIYTQHKFNWYANIIPHISMQGFDATATNFHESMDEDELLY